jgi:glutamate/tyrosine decarboxylase-like PLP-dependent enzyme
MLKYNIYNISTESDSLRSTHAMLCSGHPRFFNQLSCGLDLVSMAGEWLTATANTNMFTYEIAPVFILMEHVVMEKMREVIGFQGGDSILAPGRAGRVRTVMLPVLLGTCCGDERGHAVE